MTIAEKAALITGASGSIGEATALTLAAAGIKVGNAAHHVDRLEALQATITQSEGTALAIEMDDRADISAMLIIPTQQA